MVEEKLINWGCAQSANGMDADDCPMGCAKPLPQKCPFAQVRSNQAVQKQGALAVNCPCWASTRNATLKPLMLCFMSLLQASVTSP
eukprot:469721-Pelagomonas_calceolata.AAC.4